MGEEQLAVMVQFFKALADQSRLRLVGLLAGGPRSVEELSALLQLTPPTVSHHLARLREAGLVRMTAEGTTHLYELDGDVLRATSRAVLEPGALTSLVDDVGAEAWERKVLRDFFEGERLKEIPASRKKRSVILRWLAGQFEHGRRYSEPDLNEVIKRYHPDAATLRREMIGAGLMARDNGVYWLTGDALTPSPSPIKGEGSAQ